MVAITGADKHYFEEAKKRLGTLGSKECNFLQVELLFYEAMQVARHYGNNLQENHLLAAFKQLQSAGFAEAKVKCSKVSTQERVIKRFVAQFRAVLGTAIKKSYA